MNFEITSLQCISSVFSTRNQLYYVLMVTQLDSIFFDQDMHRIICCASLPDNIRIGIFIIYMYSSKKKQQKKTQQVLSDKVIKYISAESKNCAQKSVLSLFYKQLTWNPIKTWPQFQNKYQRELMRIKKSQTSWNYSDMRVLRNSIKKSMESQTLSVIVEKWCENLMTSIIQPIHDKSPISNKIPKHRSSISQIQGILKQQILTICQFCFGISFQIYQFFFNKHYLHKSKIQEDEKGGQNDKIWSKQQVYLYQKQVFEDYIRNVLTGLDCFRKVYQFIIDILIQKNIDGGVTRQTQQTFGSFIQQQLGINGKPLEIYKKSENSIVDFHLQSDIQQKIFKMTKIIPSIEADNRAYYNSHEKQVLNKKQTITSQILNHILKYFCPQIVSSIRYIHLFICYRQSQKNRETGMNYEMKSFSLSLNRAESKSFIDLLTQFCFLWIDQTTVANSLVVFDAFSNLQLY